ncbi:MAG TPA: polymer-forming cytoskeletal protein [Polyangiaceae bacterium]|nr:polymer-forming cytoskeletal protein [Polyangiaceae bacterium]
MSAHSQSGAVLGKSLRVRGRVRGEGDLRVEATVEGDVVVGGALDLGQEAQVEGSVEAASVVVSGQLVGDVASRGSVAITSSGSLRGDVTASELTLEEGGTFVGEIDVDFELPDAIA